MINYCIFFQPSNSQVKANTALAFSSTDYLILNLPKRRIPSCFPMSEETVGKCWQGLIPLFKPAVACCLVVFIWALFPHNGNYILASVRWIMPIW